MTHMYRLTCSCQLSWILGNSHVRGAVCHYPSHLYAANLTAITVAELGCTPEVAHNVVVVAMLCLAILAISFGRSCSMILRTKDGVITNPRQTNP